MHISLASAPVVGVALLLLQACGSAGSNSGVAGEYTSVNDDEIKFDFKSGGNVAASLGEGFGSSGGTFIVDGEKVTVTIDGVDYMFIRDGECIRDQNDVFGKLCKGGKAGETSVSTRNVPTTPTGTYVATNADGEFRLEFKPGNTLTLVATQAGGQPETLDGSFMVEGDVIHATLQPQGVPLVLKYVNETYESTSFGAPMTFVRR